MIIYALIARNGVVLAEYTERIGNFQTVIRMVLPKIPATHDRISYNYDDYTFHLYFRDGMTYMAMTENDQALTTPYLFLEDIADHVTKTIPMGRLAAAIALSLNVSLADFLKGRMDYWNTKGTTTAAVDVIKSRIETIQGVLIENIDKLVARSEKIDLLVDKAAELKGSAVDFRRQARDFHQQTVWRNRRFCILLIVSILSIILLIYKYV